MYLFNTLWLSTYRGDILFFQSLCPLFTSRGDIVFFPVCPLSKFVQTAPHFLMGIPQHFVCLHFTILLCPFYWTMCVRIQLCVCKPYVIVITSRSILFWHDLLTAEKIHHFPSYNNRSTFLYCPGVIYTVIYIFCLLEIPSKFTKIAVWMFFLHA